MPRCVGDSFRRERLGSEERFGAFESHDARFRRDKEQLGWVAHSVDRASTMPQVERGGYASSH